MHLGDMLCSSIMCNQYEVNSIQFQVPRRSLVNGIYPDWAVLVDTISQPNGGRKQFNAKLQEGERHKGVERAFLALQRENINCSKSVPTLESGGYDLSF